MKKQKYSMTAKERKNLKSSSSVTTKNELATNKVNADGSIEKKPISSKKKTALMICAGAMGIILIVFAILIPTVFYNRYSSKNPIAKMILSNGMVIEYEIFEETCPIAATNFIFLAKNKFFNDTIIFDTQNYWMRFGGYESSLIHRQDNKEYCEKIKGLNEDVTNKFGYRLRADDSLDAVRNKEEGMLSYLYNDTTTEFQVCGVTGAQSDLNGRTLNSTVVGKVLDDKSMKNIKTIIDLPRQIRIAGQTHRLWLGPKETIRIQKVTIYNLNKKKWKNFDFIHYMDTQGNAITSWVGGGTVNN